MLQPESGHRWARRGAGFALAVLLASPFGGTAGPGVTQVYQPHQLVDDKALRRDMKYQELLALSADRAGRGQFDEALKHARAAQKLDASRPDALTMQAVLYGEQGRVEQAGEMYRDAARLAPASGDVLNNYGAWLCANGYPAEALVWFDRAIAAESGSGRASALANAGGCALEVGQGERAYRDLRLALKLTPANAYALEAMARSAYQRERYLEARAFSQRRLEAAPATVSVLKQAIHIEDRLGDKAASNHYQQRLRDEFPVDAVANPQG